MNDKNMTDNERERLKTLIATYPKYQSRVKINNWNEDLYLEEAKNSSIIERMQRNELLVQMTREMIWNLCLEVPLTAEYVRVLYGATIQIKCPDVPARPLNSKKSGRIPYGLYLSGNVSAAQISNGARNLTNKSACSLSPDNLPVVRNTFMLWHISNQSVPSTAVVQYGDEFYICARLNNNSNNRLYLTTRIPLLDDPPAANNQYPVYLVSDPDRYARWTLQHWNPNFRYETYKSPVPANQKLIITNVPTGRNLCCEMTVWFLTFFGMECSVTCHTCRDTHRMEKAENIWQICTSLPKDNTIVYNAMRAGQSTEGKGKS